MVLSYGPTKTIRQSSLSAEDHAISGGCPGSQGRAPLTSPPKLGIPGRKHYLHARCLKPLRRFQHTHDCSDVRRLHVLPLELCPELLIPAPCEVLQGGLHKSIAEHQYQFTLCVISGSESIGLKLCSAASLAHVTHGSTPATFAEPIFELNLACGTALRHIEE